MTARGLSFVDKFSIAILRLLALDPLRSYYQREVAKKAGVSVGKTNQVLRALEREEVVLKAHTGKVDLYRYNLGNPLARHLKILFSLSEVADLLRKLRGKSNKVILYGSCAEGSDTKESDIDMLIVGGDKEEIGRMIERAGHSIERRVSPVILTPLEFSELKKKDPAFYEQVSRGIALWQQEE
jgi:predicted nucleotidyltransferase